MALLFSRGNMNRRTYLPLYTLLLLTALFVSVRSQTATKEWNIDEIFGSTKFASKSLSGVQWVPDGRKFSYLETDSVTKSRNLYTYNVADGKREMVMEGSLLATGKDDKPMRIGSYEWSSDGRNILITGTLPARRTKSGGNFGVFSVESKTFRLLTDTSAAQAIVRFSPDARSIGFVRENNLFVLDVATGVEKQLTFDGSDDIINGKFDWVYEEEFSIIDGYQWSPDSKRIAFWRLDQSAVRKFPLVRYPSGDAYPSVEEMRYPKAGEKNSLVKIGVVDVESKETRWLDFGSNTDIYVPRIKWTNNPQILSLQRLNRGQDTLELLLANVLEGTIKTVLTEADTAWIDINDNLRFLKKSDQFLWTSFRDGFMHIYLYSLDGSLVRQVTRGDWEVTDVLSVNENRRTVSFASTEASPLERHLYSIKFDGTGLRRLSKESGWHSGNFSPDGLVYIDSYSSANTPSQAVLRSNNGTKVAQLVENKKEIFNGYPMSETKFLSLRTSDDATLNAWMIKPADFDSTRRYPVFIHVYGLPASQDVVNRWGGSTFLWYQLLAQQGYIIMSVDSRTAFGWGKAAMQQSHDRVGLKEANDFIEAAKYLTTLSYVDSSRIGIWGWSGGGYTTCMAMTLGADYFKTGIAVAAVTDWRFYDTIFSERYMDTPQNNPEGYKETAPLTHVSKLKGDLLIIHGTTDDNVHWQNAIAFVDEAIKQNKQVQTMFYPGRAHGLGGASVHLYTMMTKYVLEKL